MREILFRGKDVISGEWVYGDLAQEKHTDNSIKCAIVQTLYTYEVTPSTVGQYTGLVDKNGKRIFEGDILKVYYYGKSKIFGVVKFDESRFFIDDDFMRGDIKAKAPMTEMFSRYEFEIVGNIYDNPDLLKGENKDAKEALSD